MLNLPSGTKHLKEHALIVAKPSRGLVVVFIAAGSYIMKKVKIISNIIISTNF